MKSRPAHLMIHLCLLALTAGCASQKMREPSFSEMYANDGAPAASALIAGYESSGSPIYRDESSSVPGQDRMLAWKAKLSLEVENASNAVTQTMAITTAKGGYLETRTDTSWSGTTLRLRVPASAFDEIIGAVESLGTVTSRRVENEDVTDQYIDTDARLKNKKVLLKRLRKLLDQATEVKDILSIETELNRIQSDIDSMTARIKSLQGRVDFASLDLSIHQTPPKPILGPLGYTFHGLYWVVEKLFVIRSPESTECPLPSYVSVDSTSPMPSRVEPPPMLNYTVQAGETLEEIGRLFVVFPDDIRRANPSLEGREVRPGDRILIPASSL